MYLVIEERHLDDPPTPELIARHIQEGATRSQCFVALHQNEDTFLQVALGRDEPVMLMSCSPTQSEALVATPSAWGPSEVIRLFCLYLDGEDAWRTYAPWQQDVVEVAIAAAHRKGRILLGKLVKAAVAIALAAVATAVATGNMALKTGILVLVDLGVFGIYIAWLHYYALRLRPRLAARLGERLNVEIVESDFTGHGWTIFGAGHPLGVRLLVTGCDIAHAIPAVILPFALLCGLLVLIAN